HPPDRADFAAGAAPGFATGFAPRRGSAQRADGRAAVERRHLAAGCAAVADFQPGPAADPAGQAAQGRTGRARRSAGLSPPAPAPPAGPDFSALERHLLKITSQIESLQRPDHIEQSIAAFRSELADIRHAITEAMPRRAIESIENEIRSLHRRIDENRQSGTDGQALANI